MTIQDFIKMREWIMRGNSFFCFVEECANLMWFLRTSKCKCEYMHHSDGLCVIFPHVGD